MIRELADLRHMGRAREIVSIFSRFGFGEIANRMGLGGSADGAGQNELAQPTAQRFVSALENLGPTFIKLGQVLSTRADILPQAWIDALAQLQEQVAPVPAEKIRQELEAAFGVPVEQVFGKFDIEPLAAASIGQVHAASLPDGTEVVVKILRPGIAKTIQSDVAILRSLAQLAETTVPELRAFRPTGIIQEFERAIVREVDFQHEARNAKRFAENFKDREDIIVPHIYDEWSSRSILVMERIDGVSITSYAERNCDPKALAHLGIDVIFSMAFVHGFFHADPHPGNIWAVEGNRIALLDMGMADIVMPDTRDILIDLLMAVVTDDAEGIAEVILRIADKPESLDLKAYKRDLYDIYEYHVRGLPLSQISMADVVASSFDAARKHHLSIPTDITMLLKSLATIEGVGKQLDPTLDIVNEARPYVLQIVSMRWGPERLKKDGLSAAASLYELLIKAPRRLDSMMEQAESGQWKSITRHEGLEPLADEISRSLDRIAFAMVILALTAGSAALQDVAVLQYRGLPVASFLGYATALSLGFVVLVAPVVRRLWKRHQSGQGIF